MFSQIFEVFTNSLLSNKFSKRSDVFGPIRTHWDAFGRIQKHLEAFGRFRKILNFFRFLNRVLRFSERVFTKNFFHGAIVSKKTLTKQCPNDEKFDLEYDTFFSFAFFLLVFRA